MKSFLGYVAAIALTMGAAVVTASDASSTSIAASFEVFWHAAQGLPFEQQEALWDRYIEQPRQELYDWVVWEKRDYPAWQQEKDYALKARFVAYAKIGDQIPAAAANLDAAIPAQVARFRALFPDAPAKPAVAVVLAPDFDSKTGVLKDGTPVLALSIDTLLLEKADPNILFPHELFHLYDAKHAGITNDGVMPGTKITLPLFEEGLATYVSTQVTPRHTDGEYLLQASLGALPASRLQEAAQRFLADADAPTIDPAHHSMAFGRWFEGNDKPYQTDLPNRSGYWLGLNLIRQMAKTYSLPEMAAWGPAQAQEQTLTALRQMAGGK